MNKDERRGKIRIAGDLFDIADRLSEIDSRYEVWYDPALGSYGIYADGALQVAVPFARLDARTVELVRRTRIERTDRIVGEIDAANKARNEKRKQILSGIAEYGYKLNELKNTLDPADLEIYQKVRMSKVKLPIVVELKDGNCRGCGMHIETELHGKLVNPGDIAECPHCRRILYRK